MPWSHDEEQRWLWDNIDESYHDQMIIMIMLKTMRKGDSNTLLMAKVELAHYNQRKLPTG